MGLCEKIGVGFGAMILKDGKVLLGQRHEDPEKADSELHGEGTWTMPGGKLEFGESFEAAVARETEEETSLKTDKDKMRLISITNDIGDEAHFVTIGFLCEEFTGDPKVMEPDEITKWGWFALDDLPTPLFSCSEKVIKNYLAKKTYHA